MRNHPFLADIPLPKTIPQYTVSCPPNSMFLRKYKHEFNLIKGLSDLSHDEDDLALKEEYNKMSKFAKKNIVKLNNNIEDININNFSSNPIAENKNILKEMKIDNQLYSSFENTKSKNNKIVKDFLENSQSKEKNKLINIKRKNLEMNKVVSVINFVDYSEKYGILYLMSDFLVGIFFKDKTRITKLIGSK